MNQISQLESEIIGCQTKIQELRKEQSELEEARRQNGQIADRVGQHVAGRRAYAGRFQQYNTRTTISRLVAGRLESAYSPMEERKLLGNYEEIHREIQNAIWRLEEEIEEQNTAIHAKQRRMEEIREEERREKERRERERRERRKQGKR